MQLIDYFILNRFSSYSYSLQIKINITSNIIFFSLKEASTIHNMSPFYSLMYKIFEYKFDYKNKNFLNLIYHYKNYFFQLLKNA